MLERKGAREKTEDSFGLFFLSLLFPRKKGNKMKGRNWNRLWRRGGEEKEGFKNRPRSATRDGRGERNDSGKQNGDDEVLRSCFQGFTL